MASPEYVANLGARFATAWPGSKDRFATLEAGREWGKALTPFADDVVEAAVSRLVAESKYAPSISEVVAACRVVRDNDDLVRRAEAEDEAGREQRAAWDDYMIRKAAGQRGIMSPDGGEWTPPPGPDDHAPVPWDADHRPRTWGLLGGYLPWPELDANPPMRAADAAALAAPRKALLEELLKAKGKVRGTVDGLKPSGSLVGRL